MIRLAAILLLNSLASPAAAGELLLHWPLDCTLGESCFVQNYMDHDPGPGHADFTCGQQTYDGHKGTDISVLSLADMQAGVAVLAAAPGTVKRARDTMADILISDPAAPPVGGVECGNGVVVDHGDGWETQYCHMKQGSLLVSPGQSVASGTPLGQVGISGRTEFPHLHLSLRQNGTAIDPFAADPLIIGPAQTCGTPPRPLWRDALPYQPGGLISVGFADHIPEFSDLKAGVRTPEHLPANTPALVLWGYIHGGRAGDSVEMIITGPAGDFLTQAVTLEKTQAQLFRASGRRNRGTFASGPYSGYVRLLRGGVEIDRRDTEIMLGN